MVSSIHYYFVLVVVATLSPSTTTGFHYNNYHQLLLKQPMRHDYCSYNNRNSYRCFHSPTNNNAREEHKQDKCIIEIQNIPLSSGVTAQVAMIHNTNVLSASSTNNEAKNDYKQKQQQRPPLVFVHGSFHSSWCWEKHYLPFFAQRGYSVVCAICLRGTGGTFAGPGVTKVQIHQHVDDISAFLKWLSTNTQYQLPQQQPVLIAHSFGGLVVMKYLERLYSNNTNNYSSLVNVSGICLACSVPPSGNGPMTLRYLRRSIVASYKLTVGFALKRVITDASLCRELFFDASVTDDDIQDIQLKFKRDSIATIDLVHLSKELPSKMVDDGSKVVSFVDQLPPCMVIGASNDYVVDSQGVLETAQYVGILEPIWVDSPHDIMLGTKWQNGAEAILKWLENEVITDDTTTTGQ